MNAPGGARQQLLGLGTICLDNVIITGELGRRTCRSSDYATESRAMVLLAEAMADSPETILQKLVEKTLELCRAHSAGISVLENSNGKEVFRWRAIAGQFAGYVDGHMPRESSPCGTVIDQDAVLLFAHPERHYPYPLPVEPPIVEALLAPVHAQGRPVGTLWVVAHNEQRKFDAEDARLLRNLSRFVSAALQAASRADEIKQKVAGLTRLHELAIKLSGELELRPALQAILETLVDLHKADFGLLSLYDADSQLLCEHASVGIDSQVLQTLRRVKPGDSYGACGSAFSRRMRVVVEDTELDPLFATYREVARTIGFRSVHSTPILTRQGEVLGVLSVHFRARRLPTEPELQLSDMCARHAANVVEALKAEEDRQKFVSLSEESSDFIAIASTSGRCEYLNRAGAALVGLDSAAHAVSAALADFLSPEFKQLLAETVLPTVHSTGHWQGEVLFKHFRSGELVPMDQIVFLIRHPQSGAALYLATVARDIRAKKHAEEKLRESDRMKTEFLAMLAHELRNPLAPIRNALQILEISKSDPAAAAESRAIIDRQLRQVVRLVDDLLDVSRISAGKLELRRKRVDVSVVMQNAVETSRPLIEAGRHRLTVNLPERPLPVDADVVRLAQVFSNLLNNAAKYSEPGGHIRFSAERNGSEVVVRLEDTGIGIPKEMLPRIFDLFAQVDRSLERAQGGLGIGLTLVKRLCDMHGGRIEAHSEGAGRGSRFIVRLPMSTQPEEDRAMNQEGQSGQHPRRRVLIVDDNRDSANTLGMLLELLGNDVRTAYDGHQALTEADAFVPDVILLDLGLPQLNGYEVAGRIRANAKLKGVTLVALTGWGQDEDRRRSKEAGFDHHLVKPADPADVQKILAKISSK